MCEEGISVSALLGQQLQHGKRQLWAGLLGKKVVVDHTGHRTEFEVDADLILTRIPTQAKADGFERHAMRRLPPAGTVVKIVALFPFSTDQPRSQPALPVCRRFLGLPPVQVQRLPAVRRSYSALLSIWLNRRQLKTVQLGRIEPQDLTPFGLGEITHSPVDSLPANAARFLRDAGNHPPIRAGQYQSICASPVRPGRPERSHSLDGENIHSVASTAWGQSRSGVCESLRP